MGRSFITFSYTGRLCSQWYLLLRYRSNTLGNLNFRKEYLLVSYVRIIHITQVVPPYCHLVITTLTGILLSRRLLYWLTIIVVLIIIDCDSGGTRTLDPSIKSAVLYLLSYEVILSKNYLFVLTGAKLRIIFQTTKCFTNFFLFPMWFYSATSSTTTRIWMSI